jgi:hypothetical protein
VEKESSFKFALSAVLLFSTVGCDAGRQAGNTAQGSAPEQANARTKTAQGCAQHLKFEADEGSFDRGLPEHMGPSASREQIHALTLESADLFKRTVDQMCSKGDIAPADIRPMRRILIQNAGGANATVIYGDSENHGRYTWVFQYTFDNGGEKPVLETPSTEDLKEGMLCWLGDEEKYKEMCEGRLP